MKRIVALALVLVMVFALAACGSSGAKPGTYKLTGMKQGDEDMSDQIAMLEAFGMSINLVLNADGTGYLDYAGEKMDLTWDAKGITVEGETVPYTLDGDSLTLANNGSSMTFTLTK